MRSNAKNHYDALFSSLIHRYGSLDAATLTSIIGFSAGGPVSLCTIEAKEIYITCELSLYKEQVRSSEGLKFELLGIGDFEKDLCRRLFTAIGDLSMESELGHGHTIDVTQVLDMSDSFVVKLELFSSAEINGEKFGIYQVGKQ